MSNIILPNQWTAREYQREWFQHMFEKGWPYKKRSVNVWHRRAGKDSAAINMAAVASQMRVGLYWHMLPTYSQAKKVIWKGIDRWGRRIIDQAFPAEMVATKNESDMSLELKNGSIYQVVGSDSYNTLVGSNPIGCIFSEYSISDPAAWDFIRPILRENEGFASFIYTPRGRNHGHKMARMAEKNDKWFYSLRTVDDTGILTPEDIQEELDAGMEREKVDQEFYCSFDAASLGAIYEALVNDAEDQGRVEEFEYNKDQIYAVFDIGRTDSTAIWFFRINHDGMEFVDYYESSGHPAEHYIAVLKSNGYGYANVFLPHDAKPKTFVTRLSVLEQFREAGLPASIVPSLSVQDGIAAGRWLLPRVRFHARNCRRGIECLRNYHYEYDEEKKSLSSKPEHDWSSHGSDAYRYAAIVSKHLRLIYDSKQEALKKKSNIILLPTQQQLTLDDYSPVKSDRNKRIA